MPDPQMWPVCPTCHAPWCLRRALSITKGYGWYWSRDCKHKAVEAVLHDTNGPVQLAQDITDCPSVAPSPPSGGPVVPRSPRNPSAGRAGDNHEPETP